MEVHTWCFLKECRTNKACEKQKAACASHFFKQPLGGDCAELALCSVFHPSQRKPALDSLLFGAARAIGHNGPLGIAPLASD